MQLRGTAQAVVSDIVRQAEQPIDPKSKEPPNVVLTVNEDKIENEPGITDNPAHALISGWERANPTRARRIPKKVSQSVCSTCSVQWRFRMMSRAMTLLLVETPRLRKRCGVTRRYERQLPGGPLGGACDGFGSGTADRAAGQSVNQVSTAQQDNAVSMRLRHALSH